MPLDRSQRSLLARRNQHESIPLRLGPCRPADAVDVVVGHVGHIEADHMGYVLHVQSPRRDVRRHQDLEVPRPKPFHGTVALRLCQVAVQFGYLETVGRNRARQALGGKLGAREDQDRGHVRVPQQVTQQRSLQVLGDRVGCLGDAHGGRAAPADLDRLRAAQDLPGQPGDHRRHGGREK